MSGQLVILSGPSGVGKDTVLSAWVSEDPRVERVVAYTTRQPRVSEVDGLDYHFIDEVSFTARAERGAFLEWMRVHDFGYATPLDDMDELLEQGKIAVLKIDVQGALRVMDLRREVLSIFLLPPSWEALEARIRGRGMDTEERILRRLEGARNELEVAPKYQHRVVNDDVADAVAEIRAIVAGANH